MVKRAEKTRATPRPATASSTAAVSGIGGTSSFAAPISWPSGTPDLDEARPKEIEDLKLWEKY